jgi:hypothetical protein
MDGGKRDLPVGATASSHQCCAACGSLVPRSRIRVRRHRGTLVCYAFAILAGLVGGWLGFHLGLYDRFDRMELFLSLTLLLPIWLVLALGRRLPRIRIMRCPHCRSETRERLRPYERRSWRETARRGKP